MSMVFQAVARRNDGQSPIQHIDNNDSSADARHFCSAATIIANYDMAAESRQTEEDNDALYVPPYSPLG